ncbi:MAG: hypothetical protein AAF598_13105, partial [Bacteroidota bacterium]
MNTMISPKASLLVCLVFVLSLATFSIQAQPMVCPDENPDMTTTCIDACIICDIDGFTGRHESDVNGTLPEDFCTFFVHNAQWIAFQAASTDIRIRLKVDNCDIGAGLEMAIYRSLDCNTFDMISNCRGGFDPVMENTSAEFENTEPLVIGQYYYLAVDGNQGDNCDWTFEVLEGSTAVDALTVTAPIQGPANLCPNVSATYETSPEPGAVLFEWTLDGLPVGDNTSPFINLSFPETGNYALCVTAQNACDIATTTCQVISVSALQPTL